LSERLPVVSGRDVVKALGRAGFTVVRQKGSHVQMEKTAGIDTIRITVPMHDTLKRGTLRQIISDSGVDRESFLALF
jgi:predicted RNA binding protein YcfA (HicA-like mRNA interferase family)